MSSTASLIQTAGVFMSAVSLGQLVRGLFSLSALVGFVMLFRPLLTGIAKALVLVVRPRLSRDQLAARAALRDARALQRVINAAQSPLDAAELRALAARS
jgi:hypothetical protein